MTDTNSNVRKHYNALNLTDRIKSALTAVAPEGQMLTVDQPLHSTSSIREASLRPQNWQQPPASGHRRACSISAAVSAGLHAIWLPHSAAR